MLMQFHTYLSHFLSSIKYILLHINLKLSRSYIENSCWNQTINGWTRSTCVIECGMHVRDLTDVLLRCMQGDVHRL